MLSFSFLRARRSSVRWNSLLDSLNRGRQKRLHRRRSLQRWSFGPVSPAVELLEDRTLLSNITVNSLADNTTSGDNLVTLREAIIAANTDATTDLGDTGSGADTIVFDDAVFNASTSATITLGGTQLPNITQQLAINGSIDSGAARVIVDGNNSSRILQVATGVPVDLQNLVLRNGRTITGSGGGILNAGTLTISNSTLSGNSALVDGGGIFNNVGTVTLTNSTLSGNSALVDGGGIFNNGPMTIQNSTLSGNSAAGDGGGIRNGGALTITASTITLNSANDGGGIHTSASGVTVHFDNTIVARNVATRTGMRGPDVKGNVTSGGHNLIGTGAGSNGFTAAGDLVGVNSLVNPLLGPLQDNGGPTFTHALLPGSPAIDIGDSHLVLDQRGFPRPVGAAPDIGAYEMQVDLRDGDGNGDGIDDGVPVINGTPEGDDILVRRKPGDVDSVEVLVNGVLVLCQVLILG